MIVCVIDGVVEFSRLWKECSDFTIIPSRENALSIGHELDGVALEAWNFDSEKFLSSLGIPNTDIVS